MRVLHTDADNVFVSEGSLLVQVRKGTMTHATLDVVERHVGGMTESNRPVGMLVVFEEGAVVPGPDVRRRQQEMVKRALARPGLHVAVAMLATGIKGTMMRTIGRTMSLGASRVANFSSIENAAAWLAPIVGLKASAIVELATRARTSADRLSGL
jgi:hypothetical protein